MLNDPISVTGAWPSAQLAVPVALLHQFGFALCRMTGLLTFLPIPGIRSGFSFHRLTLAVLFSILMMPWLPSASHSPYLIGDLVRLAASEAALGVALGLCVALISEGIQLGMQIVGLQAGFSYASTIDPSSQADSAILQVMMSLGTSLLFLTAGYDTVLFRILLTGSQQLPPGEWALTPHNAGIVLTLFPRIFVEAIRVSLPVAASLLVIDVALALLSRLQPQLQLLTLSFPIKMLAAMLFIAAGMPLLPSALHRATGDSLEAIQALLTLSPAK